MWLFPRRIAWGRNDRVGDDDLAQSGLSDEPGVFDVGVGLSLASRLAAFVRLVHIVNMVMCAAEATVGGEDGGDAR